MKALVLRLGERLSVSTRKWPPLSEAKGWDDRQAATFLCMEQERWGAGAAALLEAGRDEEVIQVLEQVMAGVF
jgi:hypothetical protein